MNVLVTGGAGFIGSNLVDAYLGRGDDVVIVDDLSSGKKENINPKAKFYHLDIQDPGIEEIFKEHKIDLVNHHAAQIDVRKSVVDPILDARINIIGLLNILQNCIQYGTKKVIFASSGGVVYGEPEILPAREDYPLIPLSPYGVTKLTTEKYLYYYHNTYGLDYTILRYGNVYGPRQDPYGEAGVIAIFINKLLKRETPTIYGDGEQVRDYIYVGDVVKANLLVSAEGSTEAFNIGTGIPTSVNKLLKKVQGVMDCYLDPIYGPKRPGEIYRSYLECQKAKEYLGWTAEVGLEEGLKKTLEFFAEKAD
ncbi:TPA: UDP-glucose 4-epimerase [bacterium]|nr:UDP-glucose 4-epimerase [bacterium]